IISKRVGFIRIVVGEHKMQPVTQVILGNIIGYGRMVNELEINSVTVADDYIVCNFDILTLPSMNSVAGLLLFRRMSRNFIVFNYTVCPVLNIDSEEIIIEYVILDSNVVLVIHFDSTRVFHSGITGINHF